MACVQLKMDQQRLNLGLPGSLAWLMACEICVVWAEAKWIVGKHRSSVTWVPAQSKETDTVH